jgi:hypothetical protein
MQFAFAARLAATFGIVASGMIASALVLGASTQSRLDSRGIVPPLPCSPRFGASFPGRPVLSWHRIAGARGARVELSPTLDFDEATIHRFDVAGERLELPVPWPQGVWYWRLRGLARGAVGERTTPTWMFSVESSKPTAVRTTAGSRLSR